MTGRDALADLTALVERRVLEAGQRGQRVLPLVSPWRAGARLQDLGAFIAGQLDVERIVWLARSLMAVRWDAARLPQPRVAASWSDGADEAWQAVRLCALPFKVADRRVPLDSAMVRRLAAGDAAGAVNIALRRLRAAGFRPPLFGATADYLTTRRWAAALAFPIGPAVGEAMAKRFLNHVTTETA
jgi:CRISPR-associated protein Csx17